jgi:Na+-driven multidrug efflux pump
VFLLAIPMILDMAMESLFGIVDVFFVARLSTDAVATVALTEGMRTIVFGVAMGLSMATTAMVARRTGEKDPRSAAVAAVQAIALGIVISLAVALVGWLSAPRLLQLMGATAGIIRTGSTYTTIVLGCVSIIFMLFLINGICNPSFTPRASSANPLQYRRYPQSTVMFSISAVTSPFALTVT